MTPRSIRLHLLRCCPVRLALGGGALAALVACAAPAPVHYYTLQPPAVAEGASGGTAQAPAGEAAGPVPVALRVAQVPAMVDRLQLVVRVPAQDPQVQVLNESLWSAPLHTQIEAVLRAALAAPGGAPSSAPGPAPTSAAARAPQRLTLWVTRFDLVWASHADLAAHWTVADPAARADERHCHVRIEAPADGSGVAGLVRAQRAAVQALGRVLATGATAAAALPDQPAASLSATVQALACSR